MSTLRSTTADAAELNLSGASAYYTGRPIADCPHLVEPDATLWRNGWLSSASEAAHVLAEYRTMIEQIDTVRAALDDAHSTITALESPRLMPGQRRRMADAQRLIDKARAVLPKSG